jgi:hypothetical protein
MTILSRFLITFCIILFISETKAAKKIDWSALETELEDIPCVQRIQRLHEHSLIDPENQEKCFKYMIEIMQGDHGINEKRQATPDEIKIIGKAIAAIRVRSINQKESLFEKVMPQGKLSEHMDALKQWDQNIYHLLSEDKSYVPKLTIFDKYLNFESLIESEKTKVLLTERVREQEKIQENLMHQLNMQMQQVQLKEEESLQLFLETEKLKKQHAEEESLRLEHTLELEKIIAAELTLKRKLKEQEAVLEEQGAIIDRVNLEKRSLEEDLQAQQKGLILQDTLSFKRLAGSRMNSSETIVHLSEMKVGTKEDSVSDEGRTSKDESPILEIDPNDLVIVESDSLKDWMSEKYFSPIKGSELADDEWDNCLITD